ncbi:glycosyltransferase [Clostridium sp. CF011]|uniref:glycosyltransferase family 2 protein n=1 Tax=Clostridium sp. CF011 TaxID=2843318 RepID=UPI001C0DAACF|nr:glycosyltransferase [Clostridium sp. CF011]MBU3093647.1 glycosyltransferase [Clostridium sp. CF011]WAG69347.1 glycosyltransferase [Clostridium sp. CF011]
MNELISIIIPVHNTEAYIEKCINSVMCQTYQNIEIIIIDDGSKDKSVSICKTIAKNDDRIILIQQPNSGVSSARNRGIELAKGSYIGFVDADDWIENDMYETLYDLLTKESADISICGYIYENTQGKVIKKAMGGQEIYQLNSQEAVEMMFDNRYYHGFLWNKLFCAKLFKTKDGLKIPLETGISIGEDRVATFRCMLASKRIVYNPSAKYHYLLNPSGAINSRFNRKKLSGFKVYEIIFKELPIDYKKSRSTIIIAFTIYNVNLLVQIMRSRYNDKGLINKLRKNVRENLGVYIKSKNVNIKYKILATITAINPYILRIWK